MRVGRERERERARASERAGVARTILLFISLVLGPLNSLLEESTDPNRYTAKAKFCFCKNNKRMIIIVS